VPKAGYAELAGKTQKRRVRFTADWLTATVKLIGISILRLESIDNIQRSYYDGNDMLDFFQDSAHDLTRHASLICIYLCLYVYTESLKDFLSAIPAQFPSESQTAACSGSVVRFKVRRSTQTCVHPFEF
jgi:hypothetical protein